MRTFVAVEVANGVIDKLQNEIMSDTGWSLRDVKPVETRNFHFTLIFLGEKNDFEIDSIKSKLAEVKFEPFMITYVGIGAFPNPATARVVWIGLDREGAQKLTDLANDVIAKMAELGFQADKPFSPHLTIFRARRQSINIRKIVAQYQDKVFGSESLDRLCLKISDLAPSGPTYSNIYTVEAKK